MATHIPAQIEKQINENKNSVGYENNITQSRPVGSNPYRREQCLYNIQPEISYSKTVEDENSLVT